MLESAGAEICWRRNSRWTLRETTGSQQSSDQKNIRKTAELRFVIRVFLLNALNQNYQNSARFVVFFLWCSLGTSRIVSHYLGWLNKLETRIYSRKNLQRDLQTNSNSLSRTVIVRNTKQVNWKKKIKAKHFEAALIRVCFPVTVMDVCKRPQLQIWDVALSRWSFA